MQNTLVSLAQQVSALTPVNLQPFTPIQPAQQQVQAPPQVQAPSQAEPKKSGNRSGRKTGAKNYTQKKVRTLINLVREYLPIGADEWQLVADEYNRKEKETRDPNSLKSKYGEYAFAKYSTGDPVKVSLYRDAHEIEAEIQIKCASSHIGLDGLVAALQHQQQHQQQQQQQQLQHHLQLQQEQPQSQSQPATDEDDIDIDDLKSPSSSPKSTATTISSASSSSSTSSSTSSSASTTTSKSSEVTNKKRNLEDMLEKLVDRVSALTADSTTATMVTFMNSMLATVKRLQTQQQDFIKSIVLHKQSQQQQ